MNVREYFLFLLSVVFFVFGALSSFLLGEEAYVFSLIHFLLSVLFLFVWLYASGLKVIREMFSKRKSTGNRATFSKMATPILLTVTAGILLLVLNVLAHRFDFRIDLTEQQVHSLSDESLSVLSQLKGNVRVTALVQKNTKKEQELIKILQLLEEKGGGRVQVQIIDPAREPLLFKQFHFSPEEKLHISYTEHEKEQVVKLSRVLEGDIIGALRGLLRKQGKVFYFLLGHGEPLYNGKDDEGLSKLSEALAARSIEVKPLLLTLRGEIPPDAAGIAMIRSQKRLSESEREILLGYTEKAESRIFIAADPRLESSALEIAANYGIQIGNDVILDTFQRAHESAKLGTQPLVSTYSTHPITRGFSPDMMTGFHLASSVGVIDSNGKTPLLFTSKNSWAESDLKGLFDTLPPVATKGEGDRYGPVPVAAAFEQNERRAVVFGDSDWLFNAHIDFLYNKELALHVFDWLAGFDESISVPERHIRASRAPITSTTFSYLLAISFLGPEFFILIGLFIWWRRRV